MVVTHTHDENTHTYIHGRLLMPSAAPDKQKKINLSDYANAAVFESIYTKSSALL